MDEKKYREYMAKLFHIAFTEFCIDPDGNRFIFSRSLLVNLRCYGSLTEAQLYRADGMWNDYSSLDYNKIMVPDWIMDYR
jgi:hypothetical protein